MNGYPVFFLPRPKLRHLFNIVVPVPPDMLSQMGLPAPAEEKAMWVMHMCRLVMVSDQLEALMVFDKLHEERAVQTGGWNKQKATQWQNERAVFSQSIANGNWPEVMTAPQMPFLVNVDSLIESNIPLADLAEKTAYVPTSSMQDEQQSAQPQAQQEGL
ncbi:MAG: hypothetical protein FGM22_07420 [Burkholderiaceae bacterium]|nr:hypothetical protein [Burkholderiaceae bacterium]